MHASQNSTLEILSLSETAHTSTALSLGSKFLFFIKPKYKSTRYENTLKQVSFQVSSKNSNMQSSNSHLRSASSDKNSSSIKDEDITTIRSTKSSISQRIKSFFTLSRSGKKKLSSKLPENVFLFDPEGTFSLIPYRSELLGKLDHLVKSSFIQNHLPFYPTSCPLKLPTPDQFHKATGLLQHGLELQEKGQNESANVNVLMAAELGVPLAMYWLAVSARYGWSRNPNIEESFVCFLFAAYLSLLAHIQQEKELHESDTTEKTHRRTVTMMNSSIKDSIMNLAKYSTVGHKRTLTRDLNQCKGDRNTSTSYAGEIETLPLTTRLKSVKVEPSSEFQLSLYDSQELAMILFEIGACYEYGLGIPRNYEDAAYYYELSAGLGDEDAAQHIGDFYRHGRGVKRDKWRAAAYYRLAEIRGVNLVNCTWIHKQKWGGSLSLEKR